VLAGLSLLSCTLVQGDLPEPRVVANVELDSACGVVPPPPPPWPIVAESPTDLGACVPASFPYEAIPVEIRVAPDGTARQELGFYDQCSGETFIVDESVQRCLRAQLTKWRWAVIETCPEMPSDQYFVATALRPSGRTPKREVSGLPQWTGMGCVG